MEIGAVSSSASTMQQMPVQARQEVPQPSERPRENSVAESQPQKPPPPEARSAENPERPQRPEQPKPVVNAQGQKTGTIISTTA
jgi:hypothetical protein